MGIGGDLTLTSRPSRIEIPGTLANPVVDKPWMRVVDHAVEISANWGTSRMRHGVITGGGRFKLDVHQDGTDLGDKRRIWPD